MQQMKISELIPHPRNNEFFDDITGEKWKEFVESIKSRGVIEPIVITQDNVIVSGHQRVRACKELGIHTVLCDVHTYNSEDEVLQDLLETNIRQRGNVGGSEKKIGLRIKELERLYGIEHGGNHGNQYVEAKPNNSVLAKTQADLAEKLGYSVDTLQNYKKLTEMIPELEELLDAGKVTPTVALAIMKEMSPEEQEAFIASLDTTKKITGKTVKSYKEKMAKLESEKNSLIEDLQRRNQRLDDDLKHYKKRLENYKEIAELSEQQAQELKAVQDEITRLTHEKDSVGRSVDAAKELAILNYEAEKFFQENLAPVKYKRYMNILHSNDVIMENVKEILHIFDQWCSEIRSLIGEDYIEVETINYEKENDK